MAGRHHPEMKGKAYEGARFFAVNFNSSKTFNILEQSNPEPLSAGMEPICELEEHETTTTRSPDPFTLEPVRSAVSSWKPAESPVGEKLQSRSASDDAVDILVQTDGDWQAHPSPHPPRTTESLLPSASSALQVYRPRPTPDPRIRS